VHRLMVLNAEQKIVGIISLSDILRHLVLEPPASAEAHVSSLVILLSIYKIFS
uniref:CBS domain-containing protein n=1 Tax=Plectus sambesii TaxID=2011161 RepID=A0A914VJX2_9BILA